MINNFTKTWLKVMKTPGKFFEHMPIHGGHEDIIFAVICYLIAGIGITMITQGKEFANIILMPIGGVIGLVIVTMFFHILFKIVGGKGTYEGTFRLLAYASATMVFSWIPIVSTFARIYMIYLIVIGGTKVHKISILRSLIAIFAIPWIITIVLLVVLQGGFDAAIANIVTSLDGMY